MMPSTTAFFLACQIFAVAAIFPVAARAEKLTEIAACARTVSSHVRSEWQPKDGAFICEAELQRCFFASAVGAVYAIDLPKKPAYAVEMVDPDLSDSPHVYRHFLISFTLPRTKTTLNLDVFGAVGRGLFERQATEADRKIFATVALKKIAEKPFLDVASRRIDRTYEVLARNLNGKTFPPGVGPEAYQQSVQKRLAGCSADPRAAVILQQAAELTPKAPTN